jgi:toluene monooxygenase system protein E
MVAAYVGALAPGGRIAVAAALQAADELRGIAQLCRWLSRSGEAKANVDMLGRELWHDAPEFQPLRQLIEELLVTYDWAAALTTLNGVVKPLLTRLCFEHLAVAAEQYGDDVLEKLLISLGDDARWHEAWFAALVRSLVVARSENRAVLQRAAEASKPAALRAVQALLPAFGDIFGNEGQRAYLCRELELSLRVHWLKSGISTVEAEA